MIETIDIVQLFQLIANLSPYVFGGIGLGFIAFLIGYVVGGLLDIIRQ